MILFADKSHTEEEHMNKVVLLNMILVENVCLQLRNILLCLESRESTQSPISNLLFQIPNTLSQSPSKPYQIPSTHPKYQTQDMVIFSVVEEEDIFVERAIMD